MFAAIGLVAIFGGIFLLVNNSTKWIQLFVGFDTGLIIAILIIGGALFAWGLVSASKGGKK